MEIESNSTAIIKRRPERGQPCLTPRYSVKKGEEKPLLMTQLEMLLYITLIQVLKFSPKLKASTALCRKSHSRLAFFFYCKTSSDFLDISEADKQILE